MSTYTAPESYAKLSPTLKRFIQVLADGRLHPPADFRDCLYDELSNSIIQHISNLRKFLIPRGFTVATFIRNRKECFYQLVKLITVQEAQQLWEVKDE